jgi:DNA (cytosine-5)-methyltransferase 1
VAAYYNEIDAFAAAWLRNLIGAGLIARGEVDTRSILEVQPDDVRGFTQAHFFAGIGVWSHALRLAGWPDDRPVWTGSCPCQPFSAAGRGDGFDDERHLWPVWQRLIAECRPPTVFGEQVASKATDPWIDLVQHDLEGLGYAVAAVPLPAAGIGAPHIRDRMWWVALADADSERRAGERLCDGGRQAIPEAGRGSAHGGLADATRIGRDDGRDEQPRRHGGALLDAAGGDAFGILADAAEQRPPAGAREPGRGHGTGQPERPGVLGRLAQPAGAGPQGRAEPWERVDAQRQAAERDGQAGGVADADLGAGPQGRQDGAGRDHRGDAVEGAGLGRDVGAGAGGSAGPLHGFWRDADWLLCRDGRWRPVEPGTFPLVDGAPARVGRLRAYGNAIVAPLAREFIAAVMECRP